MRGVDLRVPEEVADVVRAEASRRLCRPGEVLVDFVRRCWPAYVAEVVGRDLRGAEVVDVKGRNVGPPRPLMPMPGASPRLNEGEPGP
jgi:hypothetical protein